MTTTRDKILGKLRAAKQPFPDAPPRPKQYQPVVPMDDLTPDGLQKRFIAEIENLKGQAFAVEGDDGARTCVLDLLQSHNTTSIMAWDFQHIPVVGLEDAIRGAGISITQPEMHDEFRSETIETIRDAQVGLTGADAAIAATGSLVVSTGPGKGRLPTVLAPVHIAVVTLDQLIPRFEEWVAMQRANGLPTIQNSSNICIISGPSKTADIEMEMIFGVHGPKKIQVVIKR